MTAVAEATFLRERGEVSARYFPGCAEAIARLCHRMSERFLRGGRLLAFGASGPARSDARHVAVEFEATAARSSERGSYEVVLLDEGGWLTIDPRRAVRAVAADAASGVPIAVVAARFHAGVAEATARACAAIAGARGLDSVVFSGGVFQNRRLLQATASKLQRAGLRVVTPLALPPNDGGISFGQAAVAARRAT